MTGVWARVFALLLSFSLIAYAAAPPAGAPIGNQATATYTDAGDNSRTATSNQVITYVAQVAGVVVEADQTKLAAPGGQVFFPHTITNTGNGGDTFDLTVTQGSGFALGSVKIYADLDGDGIPDSSTPITNTGLLPAGESFKVVVVGIVPGTAADAAESVITIEAKSQHTATVKDTSTDTVTVTATLPVINITKAMSPTMGASPSTGHTVTFTYTNTGNSAATDLLVSDILPTGMLYAGSARWSVTGSTVLTEGTKSTASGNGILITREADSQLFTALIDSVQPGESRTISFKVDIATGLPAGILPNTGTYTFKNPDTTTSTGNTNTVNFVVTKGAGVTIVTDGPVPSVPQGGTATFINTVTNTGNAPDSFDITFDAGNTYPVGTSFQLYKADGNNLLVDTNGNNIPDTGVLAPGDTYNVVVKVTVPPGIPSTDGPYSISKRATSKNDPTKTTTTPDELTSISRHSVDLTNNESLATNASAPGKGNTGTTVIINNAANPGATTIFTLVANNTSTVSDNYNLSTVSLPAGWSVVFKDAGGTEITNTGTILKDGSKTYYAHVTVPVGQAPGAVPIDFQILSAASGATDRLRDTVTVNTVRELAITPNHTGQIFPGGTVIYNHTLTNKGNVSEGGASSTIALPVVETLPGWSSIVYHDVNGDGVIGAGDVVIGGANAVPVIAPGASIALIVKVSAPPGANIGEANVSTVSAVTTGGALGTPPATVSATDTTTVISSDLQLIKEQATLTGPFSAEPIANAAPGTIIRYRLTVVNNGTADATAVKIYDATPAFTKYTTTDVAANITRGSITIPASLVNDYVGPLEFTVGTLAPGQSAVAIFHVRINQ